LQLKYDVAECEERDDILAPLKVTMRLPFWDKDPETGNRSIRDIKEQEVFFGDVPLMTQNGTFIVNGTERVIVSQLHRSPGVFFETAANRTYFWANHSVSRSWVEFEYDQKNVLYVRIDRKRKFLGTISCVLWVYAPAKTFFGRSIPWTVWQFATKQAFLDSRSGQRQGDEPAGMKLAHSVKSKSARKSRTPDARSTPAILKTFRRRRSTKIEVDTTDLEGAWSASDIVDTTTGEVLLEANSEITADKVAKILESGGVVEMSVFFPERDDVGTVISQTLRRDSVKTPSEALIEIYRKLRPAILDFGHGYRFVPGHVLRSAQVRLFARGPAEVQHQAVREPGSNQPGTADAGPDGLLRTIKYLLKLRKNIGAWTTSITLAIAVFARSANYSRTSSVWTGPYGTGDQERCPCTRKCRLPCA